MTEASPWKIDGQVARLEDGARTGQLPLEQPQHGLQDLRWSGRDVGGSLWGWTGQDLSAQRTSPVAPPPLLDAYLRGNDLVLVYGPADNWPVETQLYWRAEQDRLSLLVSIRTQLLDTTPVVRIHSQRPGSELRTSTHAEPLDFMAWDSKTSSRETSNDDAPIVAAMQTTPAGVAVCEACHPEDGSRLCAPAGAHGGPVGWELFSHFLEKGVIRRARLTMTVAPAAEAEEAGSAAYAALLGEPLPLTT